MTRIALFSAVAAVFLASLLLNNKITLHSDILFLEELFRDLFSGGAWHDWKLTPAPAYFPDMLLYLIAHLLGLTPSNAIFIVSIVQCYIFALALIWLARVIKVDLTKLAISIILLLVALFVYVVSKSNIWFFFYSTNNHYASVVGGLVSLGLYLRLQSKFNFKYALIFVLILVLSTLSTPVFIINFSIPIALMLLGQFLVALFDKTQSVYRYGDLAKNFLLVLISLAIVRLINSYTLFHDPMAGRTGFSIDKSTASFNAILNATKNGFISDNLYVLSFNSFLVCSIIYALLWLFSGLSMAMRGDKVINDKTKPFAFSVVFSLVSLFSGLISVVASGGFADFAGYRYLAFPLSICVLLLVVLLDAEKGIYQHLCRVLVALTVFFCACVAYVLIERSGFDDSSSKAKILSICIDKYAESNDLRAGISDYWNARGVELQTTTKRSIRSVNSDMSPFFWMSSLGPWISPQKYGLYFNFVIVNSELNPGPFGFSSSKISKLLPKPSKVLSCEHSDATLWVYDGDELHNLIANSANRFLDVGKPVVSYKVNAAFLPGITGRPHESFRVAQSPTDGPGFLVFGPYVRLTNGTYEIVLEYEADGVVDSFLDAGHFNSQPSKTFFTKKLNSQGVKRESIRINVDAEVIDNFEARVWYSGVGRLNVRSLEINKLNH
jgi:hypothetical protein